MVKFGRHVDFFVANELHSSRPLYVIPYKEIQHKTCIDPYPDPPAPPSPTPTSPSPNGASSPQWHWEEEDGPQQVLSGNHITLGATTGAELASAVRQLLKVGHNRTPSELAGQPQHTVECKETKYDNDRVVDAHFFANRFQTEWRIALKRASKDFERAMKLFWSTVFTAVDAKNHEEEAVRGALPDAALQMYVAAVTLEEAMELLSFLKDIHATALINAEALRKLVKKVRIYWFCLLGVGLLFVGAARCNAKVIFLFVS
jgi:hypothetical protein